MSFEKDTGCRIRITNTVRMVNLTDPSRNTDPLKGIKVFSRKYS
jgi:hypothetical protein